MSLLLYGCSKWTLRKRQEKTLIRNYTKKLHAVLNKYWQHQPKKQQLQSYKQTKTSQICKSKEELHKRNSVDEW